MRAAQRRDGTGVSFARTLAEGFDLLLASALVQAAEFAVRSAPGMGRGKLGRQLVVENMRLALLGGVLGIPVAVGLPKVVQMFGAERIPRIDQVAWSTWPAQCPRYPKSVLHVSVSVIMCGHSHWARSVAGGTSS